MNFGFRIDSYENLKNDVYEGKKELLLLISLTQRDALSFLLPPLKEAFESLSLTQKIKVTL